MWDLVLSLKGQRRVIASPAGGLNFIGWDMTAALNLGAAMNIDPTLIAEMLPDIETVAMAKLNQNGGADG